MNDEHLIICGGLPKRKKRGAMIHELQLGKEVNKGQIRLDVDTITEKMMHGLDNVLHDLLVIATYVYVGDQVISRGGLRQFDYGHKWARCLKFVIPVCEYEIWSDADTKGLLEETLSFSSGDTYEFEFVSQARKKSPGFLNFTAGSKPKYKYDEVLLFSGGLDSFTGAVEEVVGNKSHPVLVSHQSNNKHKALQRDLHKYIADLCSGGPKPLHVPVKINKEKELTRETSQRTRSFLYASLGAIIARMFKLDRVRFYENGIVSCNLPFDGQTLQARCTRSTHPRLLNLLSELVSRLVGTDFRFENPYFNKTRTEVCQRLKELNHEACVERTRSCASSVFRMPSTHCGTCSQCIDRRFATLASTCAEFDPDRLYVLGIFTDELERAHDRAMTSGFVGSTSQIESMTPDAFVQKFSSEVHQIAGHIGVRREEALNSLYLLHKRHAKSVNAVMDRKLETNATLIRKGTLPETCLISMVASKKHLHVAQMMKEHQEKPKKHAKGELNSQVERLQNLHPKWTAQQIAEEITNTTADAVWQTEAWKNRNDNL